MSTFTIHITIGGRSYPLSIKPEQEENIRKAAEKINESVRKLKESYAVKDMQDLLAMTALQLGVESIEGSKDKYQESLNNTLSEIDQALEKVLKV